ncbi:MAG: ribbon-helix-helix domain-containing protein [Commensalibacter sp.]|nr:ribbon-helix-helix domain-containing protein [Commensalibacter sp.]
MSRHYLKKRSFQISGHRTSIALEQDFWNILDQMAVSKNLTLLHLITEIDAKRCANHPLSSMLRLTALHFILKKI